MSTATLSLERSFDAPRAAVFAALGQGESGGLFGR